MDTDFGGRGRRCAWRVRGHSEWGLLPAQITDNHKNTPLLPRLSGYHYGGKLAACERFDDRVQVTFVDESQADYLGIPWLSFNVNHPRTARSIRTGWFGLLNPPALFSSR
jgi:hypothetical protein